MYALVMKSNGGPRRQWMLGERRLVIGRSRECDLIVFDPLVSRRHCELWVLEDAIRFSDLGSNNATYVNGRPMREGTLALGDEVTVGEHTFVLEEADAASPIVPPAEDVDTPKTIAAEDTPFFKVRPQGALLSTEIASFKALIQHTRKFSEARGVSEACALMMNLLTFEFAPARCWIALFQGDSGDVSLRTAGGSSDLALPREEFRQVWRQGRAVHLPPNPANNGSTACSYMIAPMEGPHGLLGAIALADPRFLDTEHGFHYFVALTHIFAPFYYSLERNDQVSRDFERGSTTGDVCGALVGNSTAAQSLRERIQSLAQSDMNILLLGETGTGKELVSRLIHNASPRANRPYIVVNCPSIPGELFESLMFGHRKGAFTGAHEGREGYFSEAQGGTLVLDEIGDLPPEYQTRLLRSVELRTYRPVGAPRDQHADVRIIAATNRLSSAARQDSPIRTDLYHRLAGFEIMLPPLRERKEDIPELAEYFLRELHTAGRSRAKAFSADAQRRLSDWDWPGNVRELKLCVERAVVLSRGDTISADDIVLWAGRDAADGSPPVASSLEEIERWHVERVFRQHAGNITAMAQALGISRSTAYDKLRTFGIKE